MYTRSSLSLPASSSIAAAIALALSGTALAQLSDATELDEVVVTGTRTEVPLADSLVPAQVIDRAEIERSQARSLADLLKGRAGVGFTNQGGLGKLTTINLRGTESDHVLVLVDGIRIGSAAITTRGLEEAECRRMVEFIDGALMAGTGAPRLDTIRKEVHGMMSTRPLFHG